MFNKLFKKEDDYKEAYLKMDKDKVIKKEKVERVELGKDWDSKIIEDYSNKKSMENTTIGEKKQSNKLSNPSEVADNPGTLNSDADNEQDIEKGPLKSTLFLVFWLLLFLATSIYYIPTIKSILNNEINYENITLTKKEDINKDKNEPNSSGENPLNEDEKITGGESDRNNENVLDTDIEEPVSIKDKLLQEAEIAAGNFKESTNQTISNTDETKKYADVHADIIESSEELREAIQNYINGTGTHINMASIGNRVHMNGQRLMVRSEDASNDSLVSMLNRRLDRLSDFGRSASSFDKVNAGDSFNQFINEENEDSQYFIELLISRLEEENREYRLEDDIITFK